MKNDKTVSTSKLVQEATILLERMDRAPIANDDLNLLRRVVQRLQELEANLNIPVKGDRPDRLIAGDVWEFEAEVKVKGKRKLQTKTLQFKVIGYHHGECAWQLKSLDGEHYYYLMEFAPRYEEMTYIGRLGVEAE